MGTCRLGHGEYPNHECPQCRRAKRRERRQLVAAIKLERGCASCGYKDHHAALQWHHIDPETKSFSIGRTSECTRMDRIAAEIEKCVVLCANCHAILHDGEKQHGV